VKEEDTGVNTFGKHHSKKFKIRKKQESVR
jgi:hypothetical protein